MDFITSHILKSVSGNIKNIFSKFFGAVNFLTAKIADRYKATNIYARQKRLHSRYKNCGRFVKAGLIAAAAVVVVFAGFASSGATVAYNVSYGGQVIGTVSSKNVFTAAVGLAVKEVNSGAEDVIPEPKFTSVLTLKNLLASKEDIKNAILKHTKPITYASLLKVDGKEVAYVKGNTLSEYLNDYRESFDIDGSDCKSCFVEAVEVVTGYFITDKVYTLDEAKALIASSVTVKTEATVVSEEEIAFGTENQTTPTKTVGYSEVIKSGVPGKKVNTDSVVLINGAETERTNISSQITKEPVNQVVLVGTAKSYASAAQRAEAYASGFIFPINKSVRWGISSYFGGSRNHKGIDLYTSYGADIYAVAPGTVTFSGYRSDYGNLVVIDHGNGTSTAYAHASKLCVKVGDSVTAGQIIALVGSTGYSVGNHLHFEVRKGETRIDPAPYIGLS